MYLLDIVILQNTQASPADEDSLLSSIGNFIYNFVHSYSYAACLHVVAILHVTTLFLYMVLLFTHVHVRN